MNAIPRRSESNDRAELTRLLPGLVDRDLPGDRHQRLRESVMNQIHQDLRPAEQAPRRSPRRRPVVLVSALTAVAAAGAAAVVLAAGDSGGPGGGSVTPSQAPISGRQILLAAAGTAERSPSGTGTGTYWHVKSLYTFEVAGRRRTNTEDTWTRRDGRQWMALGAPGTVSGVSGSFSVADSTVSFKQIQALPADPAALKTWIAGAVRRGSDGPVPAEARDGMVLDSLVTLLAQVPAPPKVRAAAFRAIASFPNVKRVGAVDGGEGLVFSGPDRTTSLTVDPKTSFVRHATYLSGPSGKRVKKVTVSVVTAEWTGRLPHVVPLPKPHRSPAG